MRIGFDAKRAFFNYSGLGNYSRNTIQYLYQYFPGNEYFLYLPYRPSSDAFIIPEGQHIVCPESTLTKIFPSIWRSYLLPGKLDADRIHLFHGLSNEIPFGIQRSGVKSIVTIHDLIFLRYPEWYKPADRFIYKQKTLYSCRNADRIIAVSKQTKSDIAEFYNINPDRIDVVYQGCDPRFHKEITSAGKEKILKKYNLSSGYILSVGTVEKRKNLLNTVKAIHAGKISETLVVIGRQTAYAHSVKEYIDRNHLMNIRFLENVTNDDLPALYQAASVFVYPSIFEGFGIPVLEALFSKIPVITTSGGCFRESGGEHSVYVDPENIEQLSHAISEVLGNTELRQNMISRGYNHAQKFTDREIAHTIMNVYLSATGEVNDLPV